MRWHTNKQSYENYVARVDYKKTIVEDIVAENRTYR